MSPTLLHPPPLSFILLLSPSSSSSLLHVSPVGVSVSLSLSHTYKLVTTRDELLSLTTFYLCLFYYSFFHLSSLSLLSLSLTSSFTDESDRLESGTHRFLAIYYKCGQNVGAVFPLQVHKGVNCNKRGRERRKLLRNFLREN